MENLSLAQNPKSFEEMFYQKRRKTLSMIYIFGLTLNPAFGILDYYVARPYFWSMFLTRLFVGFLCLILYFGHRKAKNKKPWFDNLSTMPILILCMHFARVAYYTGGAASPYAAGFSMMILISGFYIYGSYFESLLLTVGVTLMYVGASLLHPEPVAWGFFVTNTSILTCLCLQIYFALRARYKLEEESFSYQQEIEQKNKALEKLNEAKTRFFTNLTHEFRTPLVANSTLLQAIKERIPLTPDLNMLLDSATLTLNQMLENVNDLLTQTRSEKGLLEMSWSEIEIVDLVRKNIEVLRALAEEQGTKISLRNDLKSRSGEALESLSIYGDRSKLRKVIINLLSNAIKFTKGGKVQVQLSADQGFLKIKVQDNGIGIPSQDLPHIFEPFSQASNNALRDVRGTGLGLSIVRDFIVAHHGNIVVESNLGEGTGFEVYLPLGDLYVDKAKLVHPDFIDDVPLNAEKIVAFHADEDSKLKICADQHVNGLSIAIVEDNPHVVQSLAYILKDEYNLHFARNGEEGLELIRRVKPDLVLSDIMMPKMNGYELLQAVKNDLELNQIPVVLLTAKVNLESKIQGLSEGADEYLSKPFNIIEVRRRIKNLLSYKKEKTMCVESA